MKYLGLLLALLLPTVPVLASGVRCEIANDTDSAYYIYNWVSSLASQEIRVLPPRGSIEIRLVEGTSNTIYLFSAIYINLAATMVTLPPEGYGSRSYATIVYTNSGGDPQFGSLRGSKHVSSENEADAYALKAFLAGLSFAALVKLVRIGLRWSRVASDPGIPEA